jgi:hypothetical protein
MAEKFSGHRPSLTDLMSTAHAAGFAMVHTEPDALPVVEEAHVAAHDVAPAVASPCPAPARFYLSHARPRGEVAAMTAARAASPGAVAEWLRLQAYALFGARAATS